MKAFIKASINQERETIMFREKIKVANETDAAILDALKTGSTAALDSIAGDIPPTLIEVLEKLLGDSPVGDDPRQWNALALALSSCGLTASALKSYFYMLCKTSIVEDLAVGCSDIAALQRRMNMPWAAGATERAANRLRGISNSDSLLPELEDGSLYVHAAHNDPEGYEKIIDSLGDYSLLHDTLRDPKLTKWNFFNSPGIDMIPTADDCSFFVMDGDGNAILQVEADVKGIRFLGCRETGIILTTLVEDHPDLAQANDLAVRQVKVSLEWSGAATAFFERAEGETLPAALTTWINESRTIPIHVSAAWIDLSKSEAEIERGYREAHRQSLKWGKKNIEVVSTSKPDLAMIEAYAAVYHAARRTPGMPEQNLMRGLEAGLFSIYIAYYEGNPVVALLTSRHGRTTYYCASAKVIIGNKPLGHVVLNRAIMDAKAQGQTRFDFGQLQSDESFSDKLRNIALYKQGFASHVEKRYLYLVRI